MLKGSYIYVQLYLSHYLMTKIPLFQRVSFTFWCKSFDVVHHRRVEAFVPKSMKSSAYLLVIVSVALNNPAVSVWTPEHVLFSDQICATVSRTLHAYIPLFSSFYSFFFSLVLRAHSGSIPHFWPWCLIRRAQGLERNSLESVVFKMREFRLILHLLHTISLFMYWCIGLAVLGCFDALIISRNVISVPFRSSNTVIGLSIVSPVEMSQIKVVGYTPSAPPDSLS